MKEGSDTRRVFISAKTMEAILSIKSLRDEFARAILGTSTIGVHFSGGDNRSVCLSASRDAFMALAEEGIFPPSFVTALEDSDRRLTAYEAGRRLLPRLRDTFRGYSTVPPIPVTDLKDITVTIRRFRSVQM
jgi:hypothetical protein